MKKMNVALSAAKLARLLPLLLCFVLFGSADLVAQDFKSFDAAMNSVEEALKDLGDLNYQSNQSFNQADRVVMAKRAVYTKFMELAKESRSIEDAIEQLEEFIPPASKMHPDRRDAMEQANDALMDEISN